MRNAAILELLENELERRDALWIGLANDDCRVAGRQRRRAFVLKFDRAGQSMNVK